MTDTNNGWPGKPGVPLNPEKDGWHWLESIEGLVPALWAWPLWRHCRDFWDQRAPGWMEEQEWRYHGPVLMPDEATALQSRIAELEEALATTRREGIEESAQSLIEKYQSMVIRPNTPEAWRFSILQDLRAMAGEKPNVITAADIDAVQEGGK